MKCKCEHLVAGNVRIKIGDVINAGDSFGNENSIIYENSQTTSELTRVDCVFAKTELCVLTLDDTDFLEIFHQYETVDVLKRYLQTLVYFKHCNLNALKKSAVKLKYYCENSLICSADDLPRKIYIIRHGAAKVYRKARLSCGKGNRCWYEFITAGTLREGNGFGFDLSKCGKHNLYLVSAGCEAIVIDAAEFDRCRNLKVNANLTLLLGLYYAQFSKLTLVEQSLIVSENDVCDQRKSHQKWLTYKRNIIRDFVKQT